ncbi:hypothetical protein HYW19_03680 [Candidatus Woesearchaeota archaeon]|nr:hypothetical protein [Candidatus Woesearchaeota archaeon]
MPLFQYLENIKNNIIHYIMLFLIVILVAGLFLNFGFEGINTIMPNFSLQSIRLIMFSSFLIVLPLVIIKNALLRIVGFVVLFLFFLNFEASYGHYDEDVEGFFIFFSPIVHPVVFLLFLGLDYVKEKKSTKILLIITFLILLIVSIFTIYMNIKVWNEYNFTELNDRELNVATAVQNQDCERLEGIFLQNKCFLKLAIGTANPDLCSRISGSGSKLYCLKKIIVPFNQERICSYFSGKEKDDCATHAIG